MVQDLALSGYRCTDTRYLRYFSGHELALQLVSRGYQTGDGLKKVSFYNQPLSVPLLLVLYDKDLYSWINQLAALAGYGNWHTLPASLNTLLSMIEA